MHTAKQGLAHVLVYFQHLKRNMIISRFIFTVSRVILYCGIGNGSPPDTNLGYPTNQF